MSRRIGFFELEYHVITANGPALLPFPKGVTARGLSGSHLIATLREDWKLADGRVLPAGSEVAMDVDAAVKAPTTLRSELVMAPTARESIEQVIVTKDHVVVGSYENVRGRIAILKRDRGSWRAHRRNVPLSRSPPELQWKAICSLSAIRRRFKTT